MGHYDECREGYCGICGQTNGNCEHTKTNPIKEAIDELECSMYDTGARQLAIVALKSMRWISVNEQLPKEKDWFYYQSSKEYCITILRNDNEPEVYYIRNIENFNEEFCEDAGITHWTALPEPPREVEQMSIYCDMENCEMNEGGYCGAERLHIVDGCCMDMLLGQSKQEVE